MQAGHSSPACMFSLFFPSSYRIFMVVFFIRYHLADIFIQITSYKYLHSNTLIQICSLKYLHSDTFIPYSTGKSFSKSYPITVR